MKLFDHISKVTVIPIKDILDELKFVVFNVTKEIEYEQHQILTIENKKRYYMLMMTGCFIILLMKHLTILIIM